jgi:hypothetical protein
LFFLKSLKGTLKENPNETNNKNAINVLKKNIKQALLQNVGAIH